VLWERYGGFSDLYGGGEDSLCALLHYLDKRCLSNVVEGVEHLGANLAEYIPQMHEQDISLYVGAVVQNHKISVEDIVLRNKEHDMVYTETKNKGLLNIPRRIKTKYGTNGERFDRVKVINEYYHKCSFDGNQELNDCLYYKQLNAYDAPCTFLGYGGQCVHFNSKKGYNYE
jgi:hypothetical protein